MQKLCLLLLLLIAILLVGCQKSEDINQTDNTTFKPTTEDIVDTHGTVTNVERLLTFLDNAEKSKEDNIRIVRYTVEGAPILHDIVYDGTAFTLTVDNSRDGFGGGVIRTVSCKNYDVRVANNSKNYILVDCDSSYNEQILEVYEQQN